MPTNAGQGAANEFAEAISSTISEALARPPGPRFTLDTCLLQFLLDRAWLAACPDAASRVQDVVATQGLSIAELSYYELRRGLQHLHVQKHKLRQVALGQALLDSAEILPLTGLAGWDLAANYWARLRQVGVTIGENDFLVLMTAIVHGRRLLTGDGKLMNALRAAGPEFAEQAELVDLRRPTSPNPQTL